MRLLPECHVDIAGGIHRDPFRALNRGASRRAVVSKGYVAADPERFSHIRMAAKRNAVAGVTLRQKGENSEVVPVKVPVLEQIAFVQ